jgi:hypothetical protein
MSFPSKLKIHVGWKQCLVADDPNYFNEMYGSVSEIVALIKATLMETTGGKITSVRTLESGIVEEYAIVSHMEEEKQLLFRIWPIFFTHDKRVEYKIFTPQKCLIDLIYRHLKLLAKTSGARLVEKN